MVEVGQSVRYWWTLLLLPLQQGGNLCSPRRYDQMHPLHRRCRVEVQVSGFIMSTFHLMDPGGLLWQCD